MFQKRASKRKGGHTKTIIIFLNEPGRRDADYIKKKKQRPDWAT